MSWFTSDKKPVQKHAPDTKYIVYFNIPHLKDADYHSYLSSKKAEEFATLDDARQSAREWAKYYTAYITEVNPIYSYTTSIKEQLL